MNIRAFSILIILLLPACDTGNNHVKNLVLLHKDAWEKNDYKLFESIMDENLTFAYPGRVMGKKETLKDFENYQKSFKDTKIYINKVVVDGNDFAVEWQFASTNIKTGNRTSVSDAIIGKVDGNKIMVWKEYLDGRVSRMQANGSLSLDEGLEPFPWPTKRN